MRGEERDHLLEEHGQEVLNASSPDREVDGEPVIRFSGLATHNHASPAGEDATLGRRIASFRSGAGNCAAISLNSMGP